MLQRRHDRHVVGLQHVETGCKHIGQLAFVYENGGLTFAHGQLGAVFDLVPLAFEPPDDGVAGVVDPVDDVNEFTGQEIENAHVWSSFKKRVDPGRVCLGS